MTLSNAFDTTRSALAQNATRTSIISRNIGGASNPNSTRKIAATLTDVFGSATVAITRAADRVLLSTALDSTAAASAATARQNALNQLDPATADPTGAQSLPTLLSDFQNALQSASATPSSASSLADVVAKASTLASGLNSASANVDRQRGAADAAIATAVKTVNTLLGQFASVNTVVQRGAAAGADVTDSLDARDAIVKQIAAQIGVNMVVQADGGASLYTDGGATLYDRGARAVTFAPTSGFGPGSSGNAVYVDGIPVTGATSAMASRTGAIAGLADVRDTLAPQYQNQLDNTARGLVEAFAEQDQSATPTLPAATGLFSWSGSPAVPGQPAASGLAASIRVAASVDPAQGGDPTLVRDGGIAGPAYVANPAKNAGFSAGLQSMIDALSTPRGFDVSSGAASGNQSVLDFAGASASWLASARQSASNTASYQESLSTQATTALTNATGVNLDDEMARMLDVEHSYQTSARLLSTLDTMYTSLLQSVA